MATAQVDAVQRCSRATHQRAALKVGRPDGGQRDRAVLAAIHLASPDRQAPGAPQLQLPRPPHQKRLGGVEGAERPGGRRIAAVQQAGILHLQGGAGGAVQQGDATTEGFEVGRLSLGMAAGIELGAVADPDAAIAHQDEASLGEHTDRIVAVVGGEAHGVSHVMAIIELEVGPGRRIEQEGLQHALPGVGEGFQAAAIHADRPARGGVEQRDLPAAEGEGQPGVPVGSDAIRAGGPAAFGEQLARPDPDPSGTAEPDVARAGAAPGREAAGVDLDALSGAPRHDADVAGEVVAGIGAESAAIDPYGPLAFKNHIAAGGDQGDGRRIQGGLAPAGQGLAQGAEILAGVEQASSANAQITAGLQMD